jgi:copper chaperone
LKPRRVLPGAMALLGKKDSVTLTVEGMTCGHCVQTVENALKNREGVRKVIVDLDRGEADVTFDPDHVQPAALAAAVKDAGYEATPRARDA